MLFNYFIIADFAEESKEIWRDFVSQELICQKYEIHRPLLHYSVPQAWMNDPNGLIYINGYYHLFYQHNPNGVVHGPMHWGHARTRDFFSWEELPIAIYPDEHGEIFSGSVVYDEKNTCGMARDGICPLVAVFTYHQNKDGVIRQSQGIAFSYDEGLTFEKYEGNPVLDEGRVDFRDPKVLWYHNKWIMPLVAGRVVRFYSSVNLKEWQYLSTFAVDNPEPAGVWECPELRQIADGDGKPQWVLTVSVNTPDGSCFGMQYFVGEFDGRTFTAYQPDCIMLQDIGVDHYAAVSYEGVRDRSLQMGWMNCWYYGDRIPEQGFRGSMTFPRELTLVKREDGFTLCQKPARELTEQFRRRSVRLDGRKFPIASTPAVIEVPLRQGNNILRLENENAYFTIGIDTDKKLVTMDRSGCGHEELGDRFLQARSGAYQQQCCKTALIILDTTSVELFTADGELGGTMQYFIQAPFRTLTLNYDASGVEIACLQRTGCASEEIL